MEKGEKNFREKIAGSYYRKFTGYVTPQVETRAKTNEILAFASAFPKSLIHNHSKHNFPHFQFSIKNSPKFQLQYRFIFYIIRKIRRARAVALI